MTTIAILHSGSSFVDQQLRQFSVRDAVETVDIYDLPTTGLSRFGGLIVSGSVDQELLWRQREQVRAFLDDGKVLVFSGHLFRD